MDKTKTKLANAKLAAFFDNDDDEPPVRRIALFSEPKQAPTLKKSRREKEQEAAEAKKREEEVSAAKAYAEFIAEFDGEDRKTGGAFVKADSKSLYVPAGFRILGAEEPSRSSYRNKSPSPPAAPRPKGKRAMDAFLEEIKKDQAEREAKFSRHAGGHAGRSVTAMAAYEGQSGSKDRGDPQTSNLFVANLPAHTTEPSLGMLFARAGPVGSVKIMWPRADVMPGPAADRRTKTSNLSGFVSFMKRKDAEAALQEYDGFEWGGSVLRVGWSKAVPVAPKPMYVGLPGHSNRSRSRSPKPKHAGSREKRHRSRHSSSSRSRSPRQFSYSKSRRDSRSRSPKRRRRSRSPTPVEDDVTNTFVRAVAAEVKRHGDQYEKGLLERERNNPKYGFLRPHHRRHKYYRDIVEDDRMEGPEFDDEGYNSLYSTDSGEESERERGRKTALGRLARKRFEAMLRGLSGKRGEVARCMAFSLEHAEAANEVADIIVSSLLVDETPVPRKVARLHLICDILHNSAASVPSAWKFRQEFQSRLGIVFDHLANIYHSFPGRITAETFKKQITGVVDIWEDWIVFSPDYTAELRSRLEGPKTEVEVVGKPEEISATTTTSFSSRFKSSAFQPATEPVAAPDVEEPMEMDSDNGGPEEDLDGIPLEDDVDGVPLDNNLDGEPIDDVDGEPIDDLDGEPIDNVDGEPMEDDIDGQPMDDLDDEPLDDVDGVPLMG
ncbi:hypothetical protein C8J56DRAFT_1002045 [Mycena floridula]|nr:hypothetical protein C8J56DRAFT_1002045 [Mycena floridula]